MTPAARLLFAAALLPWTLLLAYGTAAIPRRGAAAARALAARIDLAGTWAATAALIALLLGRARFGLPWAAALLLVCLMATAGLYDRAVLLPSLEAARRRAEQDPKWEAERGFLDRLGAWGRGLSLAMGLAALPAGLLA